MASDDWWTGSPSGHPLAGMTQEQKNAYRMAPEAHDPLDFDYQEKMATVPTRGGLVQGWQAQAAQAAEDQRQQREAAQRSEMAGNLRMMAGAGRRRKKKGPTMQDAGDALAQTSSIF